MAPLVVPEREIRANYPSSILTVSWKQWFTEYELARRGIRLRSTAMLQVAAAYASMSETEFDAVNGRQAWANWRTIPRALSGQVPNCPLRVIDLGSGTGGSMQVLSFYCPAGSRLTGYEVAAPLLKYARRREYAHRAGGLANVDFVCQAITEELQDPNGGLIADGSVDLINATGVIGHHLTPQSLTPLLREITRVLKDQAVALLDFGPTLPWPQLQRLLAQANFRPLGRYRSWIGDPTGQVAFRKNGKVH